MLGIGPVHHMRHHANGVVMCGVVGAQHGWQDIHETLYPVGCHVTMNHGLHGPLEAFHYGAFDVIILAGEEVYVPIFEQSLEGHCTYYGVLVSVRDQQ